GVDRLECSLSGAVLLQQALADDFLDIRAGELHAGLEARLDLGEVVALLPGAVADDLVHVLLRGDHHPGAPAALGVQAVGNYLEVEHQVGVGADELANLVDVEVEAVAVGLLVEPRLDLVREVFDRDGVRRLVLLDDAGGRLTVDLSECGVDVRALEGTLLPTLRPRDAGDALERLLERVVLTPRIEVPLKARDMALVAVVAPALVEDLHEDLEQGVGLVLGDERCLLVDVEQKALGWDALGLGQQGGQECTRRLGPEAFGDLCTVELLTLDVSEKMREHLEKVRLTGAEEARDPDTVGVGVVRVGLEK